LQDIFGVIDFLHSPTIFNLSNQASLTLSHHSRSPAIASSKHSTLLSLSVNHQLVTHSHQQSVIMGFDEKTSTQNVNWLGNARKYEWKDEYGEVGERIPELEEDLFNSMAMVREGQHRQVLDIEVRVEGPERLQPIRKVSDLQQAFNGMNLVLTCS
jgi:hypothetical protein